MSFLWVLAKENFNRVITFLKITADVITLLVLVYTRYSIRPPSHQSVAPLFHFHTNTSMSQIQPAIETAKDIIII